VWVDGSTPQTQEVATMRKSTGYSRRSWKKWLAIYAIAGAIASLIVYLLFFAHSGGAGGGPY